MSADIFLPGVVSAFLSVVCLAALGLTVAVGIILSYHWFKYGMNPIVATLAIIVYSMGCLFLLLILFGIATSLS